MTSDQILTELVSAQGKLREGKFCVIRNHGDQWRDGLALMKRFPGEEWYDLFTCPLCGKNVRYDNNASDQLWAEYQELADREIELYEALIKARRAESKSAKNGRPRGTWELCLNYSPKWYENDYEAQAALRLALERLMRYYKEELEMLRAVGEFTKSGASHIHVIYRLSSGGKFTDKNLKRAYPHWNAKVKLGSGVQGGRHELVNNIADYSGYMEKDLDVSWLNVSYPDAAISQVQVQVPPLPEA